MRDVFLYKVHLYTWNGVLYEMKLIDQWSVNSEKLLIVKWFLRLNNKPVAMKKIKPCCTVLESIFSLQINCKAHK